MRECNFCDSQGISFTDAEPWGRMVNLSDGFKEFLFGETVDRCPLRKKIEKQVGEEEFVHLILQFAKPKNEK